MTQDARGDMGGWRPVEPGPIPLIEQLRLRGKPWEELARKYGVAYAEPPWKIDLEATCDLLAQESCNYAPDAAPAPAALPALERRAEEDDLSESLYADVPFPERQLLALAHSMLGRGLFSEAELASKLEAVGRKLNEV